jgi:hypothetical protein
VHPHQADDNASVRDGGFVVRCVGPARGVFGNLEGPFRIPEDEGLCEVGFEVNVEAMGPRQLEAPVQQRRGGARVFTS